MPSPDKRPCGSPGCTKLDHHDGPCSTEEVSGKRSRGGGGKRTVLVLDESDSEGAFDCSHAIGEALKMTNHRVRCTLAVRSGSQQ